MTMLSWRKPTKNQSISWTKRPLPGTNGSGLFGVSVQLICYFVVLVSFLASGCTVGPDFYQPAPPSLQLDYLAKQHSDSSASIGLGQWWQSFGDPTLNGLLEQAQVQNLTLREAYERVVEARANFRLQGGQLKPNGNLFAAYSYNKNSPNSRPFISETSLNGNPFNLFDLGGDATWEIDLFGRIARLSLIHI